jgi:hypothetical protein
MIVMDNKTLMNNTIVMDNKTLMNNTIVMGNKAVMNNTIVMGYDFPAFVVLEMLVAALV